jgi:ubiquinone/menaquinone biosynthesis C-methylase UbiE
MPSRKNSNRIRFVLDQILPPILRDSRLMTPLMYVAFRDYAKEIAKFRERAHNLTEKEYNDYYRNIRILQDESDNTTGCVDKILEDMIGPSVCDVGCGRGYLIGRISEDPRITKSMGIDIIIDEKMRAQYEDVEFMEGHVERIPLPDESFETVISTHTIEHILSMDQALNELRRISSKRLIVVVPMEREYKFGFNLHVNFFPYPQSFIRRIQCPAGKYEYHVIDGDLYYCEDRE